MRSSLTSRAARNAVRAAKECLGSDVDLHNRTVANEGQAYDLIDLANKIIEHLAEHKTRPEDADSATAVPSDNEQCQLETDFLLLRIALVSEHPRLPRRIADHPGGMETETSRHGGPLPQPTQKTFVQLKETLDMVGS